MMAQCVEIRSVSIEHLAILRLLWCDHFGDELFGMAWAFWDSQVFVFAETVVQ